MEKIVAIDDDGWSRWIRPVRRGYQMGCCDCGLVHELEFDHVKWGRGRKIIFRARRKRRKLGD